MFLPASLSIFQYPLILNTIRRRLGEIVATSINVPVPLVSNKPARFTVSDSGEWIVSDFQIWSLA